ncbi:3-oxoacyl-ACP reductase family protein [Paenibacillus sp. M1]|uniref:3-oxoacyl-ACP reductase family protein n=1 Tax=Paenibacillus haidiansis TaxID=1574488 RepID=A0ABU7VRJ1_9BACL
MSLQNKVALVSGGSRGIGESTVRTLAAKGAFVAFTYIHESPSLSNLREDPIWSEGRVKAYKADARSREQVREMVGDIIHNWGKIDVVVNNAGIRKDRSLVMMTEQEWFDVMDTNINGVFHLTQAVIFHMIKKKCGRVINISSISGVSGISGQTNYSSSKAALIGFTRSLAKEVAPYGISVNCIAPGGVETDMTDSLKANEREGLLRGVPVGRLGKPEEVAQLVAFLADEELCPEYLTGSVLHLDGGYGL